MTAPTFELPAPELVNPADELANALSSVVSGLQLTALIPSVSLQIPSFNNLDNQTRRAWAALLRQLAEAIEPDASPMDQLAEIACYEDNWDEEGAPRPAADAIDFARKVLRWATSTGLNVVGVDADVEGGVGVFLEGSDPRKRAWVASMNDGSSTAVLSLADRVEHHFMFQPSDDPAERTLTFLRVADDDQGG